MSFSASCCKESGDRLFLLDAIRIEKVRAINVFVSLVF